MYINKTASFAVSFVVIFLSICFFDRAGIVASFLGVILALFIIDSYLAIERSKKLAAILNDRGDPEEFLAEIEKDLCRLRNKMWKGCLLINKAAGLYHAGRFQEALDILDAVNFRKLPKPFRYLYVNNKFALLLGMENIGGAGSFASENREFIEPLPKNELLRNALKTNLAVLSYFQGDMIKSRALLEDCPDADMPKVGIAAKYYFLGLMDLKENNKEAAEEKLIKAGRLASKTFLAEKANKVLNVEFRRHYT